MKTCLKKVIGRARLTYDELLTVIVECETIINSRRLTFVYSDDLEEPLTPEHLLHGRRILSLPEVTDVTVQELNRENMTRRAKYFQEYSTCTFLARVEERIPSGPERVPPDEVIKCWKRGNS